MGNIGRPSAGCLTCRKRKVKCDRSQPTCSNCQRVGKSCPGYRPESELLFQDQTKHTVARSHRKYEKLGSSVTRPSSSTLHSSPSFPKDDENGIEIGTEDIKVPPVPHRRRATSTLSLSPVLKIPPRISNALPIGSEALCLFMADYVEMPQNGWLHGHLEFLPSMLKDAQPNSCLSHSVSAVAHQYMYNLRGQHQIRLCAQKCYSQSLESIHGALEDPSERLKDSTLLSVWLVGVYEIFNGVIKGLMEDSEDWRAHVHGTALLIRLRGQQQFEAPRGRAIFRLAHGLTSIHALMTGNPPLVKFDSGCLTGSRHDWIPPEPLLRSSFFFRMNCMLCAKIKARGQKPIYTNKDLEELRRLKDEALRVEAGMQDWTGTLAEWQPRLKDVSLHSMDIRQFAHSDLVEYHENSFPQTHWNLYRANRIALHETLLDADHNFQMRFNPTLAQEAPQPLPETAIVFPSLLTAKERHHCLSALSSMSSQLLGTIPHILGDIDSQGVVHNPLLHGPRACAGKAHQGIPIIWPLRMIKRSLYTDERQKYLATEALKKIGWGMGIRQALEVAEL